MSTIVPKGSPGVQSWSRVHVTVCHLTVELHKVKDGLPMLGCSAVDTTTGVCERAVRPGSRR